jgi:ABC-type branched-subunit amino acid transport system substrate-binding protein
MKRSIFIPMLILIALSPLVVDNSVTATNFTVRNNGATEVKVALLTPQTGGLSAYSSGFENAAALAIVDINADTRFADYTFSITEYDTATTPEGASAAMTQAATDGVVYAVGAAGSSNTLAAAAVAISNTIPLISYASTSPALTTFDDHAVTGDEGYVWRTPPSDALQGEVISDLADDAGFTSMVIVHLDNAYGGGLANATKDEFVAAGGSVSLLIPYAETTTDFSAIVTQIIGADPDVIVAISYATDGSLLFVELSNQDVGIPVIGADGVADVGIFDEAEGTADAMEGFVLTKPAAKASAKATAFSEAYAAAYPSASGDIYTGETYDAVWAGAEAVLDAASTTGSDIIASLATISFTGVTGTISFDDNGDSSAGYYSALQVQCGKAPEVGSWEAGSATYTDGNPFDYTADCSSEDDSPFPIIPFAAAIAVFALISRKRKY